MTRLRLCTSLALALGLTTTFACTDDGSNDASDETAGDGDGDPTGDGDGDGDGDPSGDGDGDGESLSHAADIQPIWDANCVTACHEPGGSGIASLDLSGDAYDNIVGVTSGQAPGLAIVNPGSADMSYLVNKLRGTQSTAGGLGGSMPAGPGAQALDEPTILLIEAWIDTNAAP